MERAGIVGILEDAIVARSHARRLAYAQVIDPEPNKSDRKAHSAWEWRATLRDRLMTQQEFDDRVWYIERYGLPVKLRFEALPDDVDAYRANSVVWDDAVGDWVDRADLLKVYTDPQDGFAHLANREQKEDEIPYHISLCFTNELHRFDLYDASTGVEQGKRKYDELRARYNGKTAMLWGKIRSTMLELTHVIVDMAHDADGDESMGPKSRELLDEADLKALHAAGRYHDRSMHVSM